MHKYHLSIELEKIIECNFYQGDCERIFHLTVAPMQSFSAARSMTMDLQGKN